MTDRTRQRCILLALTGIAAVVFFTGIGWGLPSRAADRYLFGTVRPWSGEEILQLAGDRTADPSRGADVALHPIADRTHTVVLNETDRQRAEIVRRYRLYTYQPDEASTLMSLAGMNPRAGNFDPKLYQYGGLYIYPVGAALKLASLSGLIDLKSNVAYYLDHPDAFGRFYVVARITVALWGIAGVWVVFGLTKRLTHGMIFPALAGLGYVFMPVVVNMSHEAKPHLPGAVLMLLTVGVAEAYVRTGHRKWAILAGAVAGAAMGMVISSLLAFSILPVMTMLRRQTWRQRILLTLLAVGTGIAVYFLTNPYVAINLVRNRAVLRSNLGNTTNMYHVGGWIGGLQNGFSLLAEGASPGVLVGGWIALAAWVVGYRNSRIRSAGINAAPNEGSQTIALLLAVPAGLQCIQFMALAAGKPGEYGRFAIFLDVTLLMATMAGLARLANSFRHHHRVAVIAGAILVGSIGMFGGRYLAGFVRDCRPLTSRLIAAAKIRADLDAGARSIALWAEPAPYSFPPVDLFKYRLLLVPPDTHIRIAESPGDLSIPRTDAPVFPIELSGPQIAAATIPARSFSIPAISWADRSFCILRGFRDGTSSPPPPAE